MRCKKLKADGSQCGCFSLHNEEFCLFHSKSEAARQHRKSAHKAGIVGRVELLRSLSEDFRALRNKQDTKSRELRLRIIIVIRELKSEVDELSKIRRLVREKGLTE